MSNHKSSIWANPRAQSYRPLFFPPIDDITHFHRTLEGYKPTPLHNLHTIAHELGAKAVLLKDESNRYGLPSFKILGASWAVFRELTRRLHLPTNSNLSNLGTALGPRQVKLFAATDGNHGRAVARMGKMLGVKVQIHVPVGLPSATIALIRGENAAVVQSLNNYDGAIQEAFDAANELGHDGVLIQDFSFGDYQEIPQWIVDGYSTMFREVEHEMVGALPDLVVVPVGVGSFAQAAVTYFKHREPATAILAVEPKTAACLHTSLRAGHPVTLSTSATIMNGLECGTVSDIAWPILQDGVDASMVISDAEAHDAVQDIRDKYGMSVGPCGAAGLAAISKLSDKDKEVLGLTDNSTILLLCTEGHRDYNVPLIKEQSID